MATPYLFRLDERLSQGLSRLDPARRELHRQFLLSQQNPDGGFGGRGLPSEDSQVAPEGRESDLYYTAFGVRALVALKAFDAEDARRVSAYLLQSRNRHASVIDVVSWLYSALVVQIASGINVLADADANWPQQLSQILESFRTSDGGYAKTREGALGSTYHSFLVALCKELIGQPVASPDLLVKFILDRQRDDGGFVEIAPMKRSGTNPTAAAIAVLTLHSKIGPNLRADVLAYLKDVRSDEGGFQANSRIPFADTLSTFTGYLTCLDLEERSLISPARVEQFIMSLEQPEGGFRAATWDKATDVEYTFYALGTLGLAWSQG